MAPDRLIVIGGGSKSDLFMQIFADAYNLPPSAWRFLMRRAGRRHLRGRGGGGLSRFETAVARIVRVAKVFKPIPEHVEILWPHQHAVYRGLRDQIEPILKGSYPIFH